MRYVLYESDNATINVIEEVRFIENYIALMKIRYTDDVDVRLEVQDPMPSNIKIPPLLLIVLVENAFKHGVSYNKASFVHISIECTSSEVICQVDNSRHNKQHPDKKNSGVGLDNMQKRLDLLFGDKYQLLINSKNPEIYSVTLKMPINNDEMYSNR
jgi:LytS/YehU family sensor histidine kinase